MRKLLIACLLLLMAQVSLLHAQETQTPDEICAKAVPAAEPQSREFEQPEQVIEQGVDYRAIFCTGAGAIYIDLLEDYAPITVNNFVFLTEQGYYNNTTFHRVLPNFMAQGGDPTGTGMGGPGYTIADEFAGFLTFDRPGWLAMANTGQPNSGGAQFFITTVPYPSLDFGYTIFGEVLQGQENVESIDLRDPETATEPGETLDTIVIVTDSASVETTYEAPAPASQEDVQAIIDQLNSQIPDTLAIDEGITGIFDTGEVVANAPASVESDYAAFLEAHSHEYRAGHGLTNVGCDLENVPFIAIGYTLDRFATPEDAAAALNDGFLDQLAEANGYSAADVEALNYPLYTQETEACGTTATQALTYWQRGHFVVTIQAVFAPNPAIPTELWLTELVGLSIYEPIFSSVLRAEIR